MPKKDKMTLQNTQRRPLVFNVAGKTIRLAPGERVDVPASWMNSGDLQRFHGVGFVQMEGVDLRPPSEGAEEEEDDDEKKSKGSKTARKSRTKSQKDED